ncbi:MAG: YihY/virulence factor BrkB family protein [Leptolyngbyaceae cyanobacterium bins.302]|nr:YihY/virulence factor BrkB family protein [Leptolyngbyaceae cyanobacterium bins.302]
MRNTRFVRFFRHLNFSTVREIIVRSGQQRLPGLAAEIAFNSILALFPAIVALLTVVGMVGSSQKTLENLSEQLIQYAPQEVLNIIESFIHELSPASSQGLLSVSFIAAIWIASGAISSTMSALDQIHQVPSPLTRPFWKAKLISIGLTFGTILLLVAASVMVFVSDLLVKLLATQGEQIVGTISQRPGFIEPGVLTLWSRLSMPIALGMVALGFAFVYRFGPSRRLREIPILPGAILATIFWALFSGIFRLYVLNFGNYNRVYGTVGAIVVLLLWLQLGALTMLIGAQLNVTVGERMRQSRAKDAQALTYITDHRQENAGKNQYPKNTPRNKAQQRYSSKYPDQ